MDNPSPPPPSSVRLPIYYRRSLAATSEKGPTLWPSPSEGRLFDFCWWENIAQYITPVNAACPQTKYKISDLQHISFYIQAKMVSADVFWYSRFKRNDTTLNIQGTHIWYISKYTKLSFRFHKNVYLWIRAGSGNNFNHQHRNRIRGLASTVMWFPD